MKDGRGASIDPAVIRLAAQGVGLDLDGVLPLVAWAAIGLTHLCWRNSVLEDWHAGPDSRISDAEMMQANVATTRIFRRALGRRSSRPGRQQADQQPGGLVQLAEEDGVETALLALAISGRTSCDGWWGSPRWPGIVDVVLRAFGTLMTSAGRSTATSRCRPRCRTSSV